MINFFYLSLYLLEITNLLLVSLDISCNKISALPVELRSMSSLVDLELCNNPLSSPPASLCVRGLVHVFKYLETVALKEKTNGSCGIISYDGNTTLRRTITPRHGNSLVDGQKNRRQHVDSGYSTSDGLDKKWLQDSGSNIIDINTSSKYSPTPLHIRTDNNHLTIHSGTSTPSTISPTSNAMMIGGGIHCDGHSLEEELKRANHMSENNKSGYASGGSSQSNR